MGPAPGKSMNGSAMRKGTEQHKSCLDAFSQDNFSLTRRSVIGFQKWSWQPIMQHHLFNLLTYSSMMKHLSSLYIVNSFNIKLTDIEIKKKMIELHVLISCVVYIKVSTCGRHQTWSSQWVHSSWHSMPNQAQNEYL